MTDQDDRTIGPPSFEPAEQARARARRGRRVRRFAIGAMVLFVAAGVFGVFGSRQATRTVVSDGVRIDLTYPSVTRGGLPSRWLLEVRTTGGEPLPSVIEVRTTAAYFELFDHNDLTPEPDDVWQDELVAWTFHPAGEDQLRVELDVRTQPDARWRYRATTTVLAGSDVVADVEYSTLVVP